MGFRPSLLSLPGVAVNKSADTWHTDQRKKIVSSDSLTSLPLGHRNMGPFIFVLTWLQRLASPGILSKKDGFGLACLLCTCCLALYSISAVPSSVICAKGKGFGVSFALKNMASSTSWLFSPVIMATFSGIALFSPVSSCDSPEFAFLVTSVPALAWLSARPVKSPLGCGGHLSGG